MTNDQDDLRDHLTFSQRHGYEPLPEPMKLEEISDDLRRKSVTLSGVFFSEYVVGMNSGRILTTQKCDLLSVCAAKWKKSLRAQFQLVTIRS